MKYILLFLSTIFLASCSTLKSGHRDFNRKEYVQNYLNFAFGQNAGSDYPKIRAALTSALYSIPEDVLEKVTDSKHPVLFTVNITKGIARWANSSEINVKASQDKVFKNGFYLIKLADQMENVADAEAIEGVVLHELAHDYSEHLKKKFSCEMEREANQLVKTWGQETKYLKAKEAFGSKEKGDSPCRDDKF